MHRSRLRAIMIDVPGETFDSSAVFWAAALGRTSSRAPADAAPYLTLLPGEEGIRTTLQRIDGDPRIHLDIETDDVEAEVARLQSHGAHVVDRVEDWVVMRDPAGLPLCVIPVDSTDFPAATTTWP